MIEQRTRFPQKPCALVATGAGIRSKQVQLEQLVDGLGSIVCELAAGSLARELFVGAGIDFESSEESPCEKLFKELTISIL